MQTAWGGVTVDSRDPELLARFWSGPLSTKARPAGEDRPGWWRIGPLTPGGPTLNPQPVPEPKRAKARIHLDVWVDDLDQAETLVVALGGMSTGTREVLPGRGTILIAKDPEGHEFCLLGAA